MTIEQAKIKNQDKNNAKANKYKSQIILMIKYHDNKIKTNSNRQKRNSTQRKKHKPNNNKKRKQRKQTS